MVGGVGDEALGDFVQRDSGGGLQADGEKDVVGDVVVVLGRVVVGVGGV